MRCLSLRRHAPKDIVVALGRAMGSTRLSIFITLRRFAGSRVGGFRMCPARQSVTGAALLAAESDEALMQRFTRSSGVIWRRMRRGSSASGDTCCGITR